jgi:hypothetical protein
MKTTKKAQKLLERMAAIREMERGAICRMKGRKQLNHQTWEAGRNVVRYVRPEHAPDLRRAIDGYARFMALVRQYADEIIRLSRREREKNAEARKTARESKIRSDRTRI